MGIKRSVVGLVTTMVAASALATGLSIVTPNVYHDMHNNPSVGRLIINADSATTSTTGPDVYYDM